MKNSLSSLFFALSAVSLFAMPVVAGNDIDYLQIDNDIVLFSVEGEKSDTSPACVSADKADLWSVSLASDSGRAIYSLILTAMAKDGMGIEVNSAGDCAVATGVERADKVSLGAIVASSSSSDSNGKSLAVYKGDLSERLGAFVDPINYDRWRFVDENGYISFTGSFSRQRLYFIEADCQGDAYTDHSGHNYNAYFESGRLFKRDSSAQSSQTLLSVLSGTGECSDYSSTENIYPIMYVPDDICGDYMCKLVEE